MRVFVTGGLGFIGKMFPCCGALVVSKLSTRFPRARAPPAAALLAAPHQSRPIHHAGSHTVLALLERGHTVTMIDNLFNSFPRVFDHMRRLAGDKADAMQFIEVRGE
jgi:nucleoside-diphosphate-sugar epimerase